MTGTHPLPTPLTLVAGFLGSGKTTLLTHLLQSDHGRRLAVVVNDFGTINIDAELIREVQPETQTLRLTNGCICCGIRDDLVETVGRLVVQADAPDHVIIETSGVADPLRVAEMLAAPELLSVVRVDAIVTIVDSEQIHTLDGDYLALAECQISAADLLLLNKTDLLSPEQLAAIHDDLQQLAPKTPIIYTSYCRIPAALVLSDNDLSPPSPPARASKGASYSHHHTESFETFTWTRATPLDAEKLHAAIMQFPPSILRGKGFVYTYQAPQERCILQLVGQRASLTRGRPWADGPSTELVFIGTAASNDRKRVVALLNACTH